MDFAEENVTSGTIAVKAKFSFITVIDKTFDLCTEIKSVNRTCPVNAITDGTVSVTETLPSEPIHVC